LRFFRYPTIFSKTPIFAKTDFRKNTDFHKNADFRKNTDFRKNADFCKNAIFCGVAEKHDFRSIQQKNPLKSHGETVADIAKEFANKILRKLVFAIKNTIFAKIRAGNPQKPRKPRKTRKQ
jgi:hypothetical protein